MSYFLPIQCTFRLSRAFDTKERKKHFVFLFQDPNTYGEWNMKGVILEPKYMYEPQPFSCVVLCLQMYYVSVANSFLL